ncbi:MAG: S1 RNA-binding domain-containing protein [Chloroflexota bacterium]|nr:S1 RNA-binding domain-containing protein [Chloroflexota bacterium]
MPFGAFLQILPGKDGMVHISELAQHRVPDVESVVNIGDELEVMVINIDGMGRIDLSHRALLEESNQDGGDSFDTSSSETRESRGRNDREDRGSRGGRGSRRQPRDFDSDRRPPRSERSSRDDGSSGDRRPRRQTGGYDGSGRRSGPPRRR